MKRSEIIKALALDLENAGVVNNWYNYFTLASRIIQVVEKCGMKPPLATHEIRVATLITDENGNTTEDVTIEKIEDYLWEKEE